MDLKGLVKHSGKAATVIGLGIVAFILIKNLAFFIMLGILGLALVYRKEVGKLLKLSGVCLDKFMIKNFPLFSMRVKMSSLKEKVIQIDKKLVIISKKRAELVETKVISEDRNLKEAVKASEKVITMLDNQKTRLNALAEKTKTNVSRVEDSLSSREIVHGILKDSIKISKSIKSMSDDETLDNTDSIDIDIAGLHGELEELLSQIEEALK